MQKLKALKKLASNYSVLYVEDDENIAKVFKSYLEKMFKNVDYRVNGQEGLEAFKTSNYDLVITDILMPKMDGLEMSTNIKEINEEQNILVTSAYSDTQKFITSIKIGIDGYIIKPIDYDNLNTILYKILTKIQKFKENEEYEKNLEYLIEQKTNDNLKLSLEKVDNYEKTLIALIDIIESRDTYTGKHSLRVANYTKLIADELGIKDEEGEELYRAAILHDIGKIAIPDSLLLKPGKLNDNEYHLIKEHVNIGFHMLIQIPMFSEIAKIINCHHERLDGSGYPNGLKGDEIPFKANIMALADSFDAMTTSRIYKGRRTIGEALEELKSLSGIHFKKEIVDAALKVLKDINLDETINQLPQTTLEEERFSYFYKDPLTGLFNEKYLDFILSKNIYDEKYIKVNLIFLHGFTKFNNEFGWTKGNEFLSDISNKLSEIFENTLLFRIHGDDFVILSKEEKDFDNEKLKKFENYIKNIFDKMKITSHEFSLIDSKITSVNDLEKLL